MKRPVAVGLDELDRRVGQTLGAVLVPGALDGDLRVDEADVKALFERHIIASTQVPLANVQRGIAGFLQAIDNRQLGQRQRLTELRWAQLRVVVVPGDVGEVQPRRIAAGQEAGPGGCADGGCRIGLREAHAPSGQTIQVRGFVEVAGVGAKVASGHVRPARIVGQDDQDVRPLVRYAEWSGLGAETEPGCHRDQTACYAAYRHHSKRNARSGSPTDNSAAKRPVNGMTGRP